MARCSAGSPTSRGKQQHSHLLCPRTPVSGKVTPFLHSAARASFAGAAVPLCQVILVALVLRVEIIWLCRSEERRGGKDCRTQGEVQRRNTHQQAQRTALSSGGPQDSSLSQSDTISAFFNKVLLCRRRI